MISRPGSVEDSSLLSEEAIEEVIRDPEEIPEELPEYYLKISSNNNPDDNIKMP